MCSVNSLFFCIHFFDSADLRFVLLINFNFILPGLTTSKNKNPQEISDLVSFLKESKYNVGEKKTHFFLVEWSKLSKHGTNYGFTAISVGCRFEKHLPNYALMIQVQSAIVCEGLW